MKQKIYFQIVAGDASFPLTPALSSAFAALRRDEPAEREKCSQLFGKATLPFHRMTNSGFCSMVYEF